MEYLRANEAIATIGVKLDVAAHEYASAFTLLGGRATILETARDWMKRNAVGEFKVQFFAERQSRDRQKLISAELGRLASDIVIEIHEITPDIISRWLSGLPS